MRFSGFLCVVYVMCKLFREDRWVFNGGHDIKKKKIYIYIYMFLKVSIIILIKAFVQKKQKKLYFRPSF